MSRKNRYKVIFEEAPCKRGCGRMVLNTRLDPPQNRTPLSWDGVCEQCWTPEERKKMNTGLSHLLG